MTEPNNRQILAAPALPSGWTWVSVGELAHLIRGVTYQKDKVRDKPQPGYIPILRATNIQEEGLILGQNLVFGPEKDVKAEQLLQPGDVVICMSSGSRELVGKAAPLEEPWRGACGAFCAVVRFKSGFEPKWGRYFFRSDNYRRLIQAAAAGVNINNLRYDALAQLRLPVPPLGEQQRLVALIEHYFHRIDAGVTALRRAQAKLQNYRAAVLEAAVSGRLVAQDPVDESAAALLGRLRGERISQAALFEPLPDLPPLAQGWTWARLAAISDALGGYAFKSRDFSPSGWQIVKIANVEQGRLNLAERPTFIKQVKEQVKERYRLQRGDLLISLTGTRRKRDYGFVAPVQAETGLLLNQRVARLRFHAPLNPHFFELALQGGHFINRFFAYETGNVGQGNVRIAAIIQEVVPVPPLAEQARIVAAAAQRFAAIKRLENVIETNLRRAELLRQAILGQAFSGRLSE
ncbi:MAG: restriction endonuclease subunit S [Anaerolineae bacterium]|nr:restriction endonuclease subunit S [Anaerolineae bacterium]